MIKLLFDGKEIYDVWRYVFEKDILTIIRNTAQKGGNNYIEPILGKRYTVKIEFSNGTKINLVKEKMMFCKVEKIDFPYYDCLESITFKIQ
jgi:hypothetical protein